MKTIIMTCDNCGKVVGEDRLRSQDLSNFYDERDYCSKKCFNEFYKKARSLK